MTLTKDFFVSYTGADTAWAEWIADTLERAGYSTVLQAWDFRPGQDWVHQMHEHTQRTARTIAVLSPAYLGSVFGEAEWRVALANDPTGEQGLLVPVRVTKLTPPGLLRSRVYIDLAGLDEQAAVQRLLAGVQSGRTKPAGRRLYPGGRDKTGAARFPGRSPEIFDVPPRNLHFTGRDDLLRAVRHHLAEARTGAVVQAGAVHGLGGVGKTQLAVEYAHRYAVDYDLVWWIPAEQPLAIAGSLAALARRLGLLELSSLEEQVGLVFDELGQRDRWLLVYDNAQTPAELSGLRPPAGGGHLLVTSRNPAWAAMAASIAVNVLPHDQATSFLMQRTASTDQASLAALAEALGNLPLALEQAAAYLEETGIPPGEYLELLHDRAPELFALGQPATTEQTIATTWTVSLERIHANSPAAQDLLTLFAFLAPDNIPRDLLAAGVGVLTGRLASVATDAIGFQQAIGALRRYSLVSVRHDTISVHRLVQAVVRHALDPGQLKHWAATGLGVVLAVFPDEAYNADTWPLAARLLPHALAVTADPALNGIAPAALVGLLNRVGDYLWGRGEYSQARPLLDRSRSVAEARLGPDHPDTASSLNSLGQVLRDLGDLDRARDVHERALAIREAQLGPEHPDTATSLINLGRVLRTQVDLDRAHDLLERALAIYEARLGPDHPDTAWSLNNLARTVHAQGDLDRARTLHQRALAIREAQLGPDHPATATSLTNLALVLTDQGDLTAARDLHEPALAIYEARSGPEHPDTAESLTNLGSVLRKLGQLEHARDLHERALAIYETRFGPDHPHTAWSLSNLANVLRVQGDLDRARALHERGLAINEAHFGPDHLNTAWSLSNLGIVLHAQGNLAGARSLHERALAIREARLGSDHQLTAWGLNHLGRVLADQDDLDGARVMHERALAIREARLGPDHPRVAQSLSSLAGVLSTEGDLEAARSRYERALRIYEARLDPDHLDTVRSRRALAAVVAALDHQ